MTKLTKISLLTALPLAVLLLSGCGSQTAPKTSSQAPAASKNTVQDTAQTATDATESPAAASAQAKLEPLPADDKQAIDTELSNIDKDLKSTDNSYQSTDLSNANLGL